MNAILKYNYEDLFIMKIGFGFAYNDGRTAVKTNMETAGNLLDLYSHAFNTSKNDLGLGRALASLSHTMLETL